MDYFREAFGGFAPDADQDAAIKFVLDVILSDERLDDLADLMAEPSNLAGLEGEPHWILQRRRSGKVGYDSWPGAARYRAFVHPKGYGLAYPEFYMDEATFDQYVSAAVRAYVRLSPEKAADLPASLKRFAFV